MIMTVFIVPFLIQDTPPPLPENYGYNKAMQVLVQVNRLEDQEFIMEDSHLIFTSVLAAMAK